MAREAKRACGYRKVGGLYLVGEKHQGMSCCKLPIPLHVCPTCSHGVKQTRGWSWIDPRPWLAGKPCTSRDSAICPAAHPELWLGDRVGLLWIGGQFYPTVESFAREAAELGVSRRITAVPRGLKVGEHWVFLAHPKGIRHFDQETLTETWTPAVFKIFKPTAIEKILTESMATEEELEDLEKRGIKPVIVPDDDRDHQGTVYEDFSEEQGELRL